MGIPVSHQDGDRSPVMVQNAQVIHHASVLIHTGAKNLDSPGVIELAVQVKGRYGDGEPIEVGIFDVVDALVFSESANGLTSNLP